MSIYKITVQRPVAISMVVLGVVVFGLISYKRLPLNLMPTMTYPRLTIRTEYPGSGPEEVERQISRPIEAILGTVSHLVRITSHSRAELSELIIEFDWKVNMDLAIQEVREKIDLVRFPDDVKRPMLLRYDPNLDPMMRVGLWGRANLFQLRRYAEEVLRPALETLSGVAAVKIRGGLEREIEVAINEAKLSALGMSISRIVQRLKQENINLSGGRLKEGETHYWVRTLNEFKSIEEIGRLIIEERGGKPIYLRDIARLQFHAKDQEIITRLNGQLSVELSIFREADANIVDVARRVRERIFGSMAQRRYVSQLKKRKLKKTDKKRRAKRGKKKKKLKGKVQNKGGKRWGKDARKKRREKRRKKRMKRQHHRRMTRFLLYHLPTGMNLRTLHDQAIFIKFAIREVLQSAVVGGFVAVFVLLLFLRHFWSTLIIGFSIPISVVATFAGLYLVGVSLNIMSLGGLALGIGMLVDNSIVVLESILRFREDGHSFEDSAVLGVAEVGAAVTASTLTTVAVFFPIVFVQGAAGQLLRDLAITVVLSLLSSLIVSLFFIPMLSALKLSSENEGKRGHFDSLKGSWQWFAWHRLRDFLVWGRELWSGHLWKRLLVILFFIPAITYAFISFLIYFVLEILGFVWRFFASIALVVGKSLFWVIRWIAIILFAPMAWMMDRFLSLLNWGYPRLLSLALKNRLMVIVLSLLMGFGAYELMSKLQREFVPKVHQGEFNLELTLPVGTPLKKTAKRLKPLEKRLSQLTEIKTLTSTIGIEKTAIQNADKGEHSATIMISLHQTKNIERQETQVLAKIRAILGQVPGLKMKVTYPSLFSLRTPIEVEIRGEDLTILNKMAHHAQNLMQNIPSLRDIRSSSVGGLPEIQILYNREKLLYYGLSVEKVAQIIRNKVHGSVATRFRERERRIDVLVRVQRQQLKSVNELLGLSIHQVGGQSISLSQVARLKIGEGPSQILRIGSQRAILLRAELEGMALGKVTTAINSQLAKLKLPLGYSAELSGQSEEMKQSLNSLLYALLLSIFLVYLVMASQFESLMSPFVILFSIPLAFIGVIIVFWWLDISVSVMVLIGLIILAGIVVNNAIVLVDAINKHRERGMELSEAIKFATKLRLRPILMTTSTTVLGLLPLALGLGEGSELRRPMAITIMVGLIFSTLLTLIVIPVLYRMVISKKRETMTI